MFFGVFMGWDRMGKKGKGLGKGKGVHRYELKLRYLPSWVLGGARDLCATCNQTYVGTREVGGVKK